MRLFSDCFYHFLKLRSVVLDSGGMVETPCRCGSVLCSAFNIAMVLVNTFVNTYWFSILDLVQCYVVVSTWQWGCGNTFALLYIWHLFTLKKRSTKMHMKSVQQINRERENKTQIWHCVVSWFQRRHGGCSSLLTHPFSISDVSQYCKVIST